MLLIEELYSTLTWQFNVFNRKAFVRDDISIVHFTPICLINSSFHELSTTLLWASAPIFRITINVLNNSLIAKVLWKVLVTFSINHTWGIQIETATWPMHHLSNN